MFEEKMKLSASLGVYERLEITSDDELGTMLDALPDLKPIETIQSQRTELATGRVRKEVTVVADYPERLTEDNVKSLADHYGVTIRWRGRTYEHP